MTRRYVVTITPEGSAYAMVLTDAGTRVREAHGLPDPESAAELAVVFARADTAYHGGLTDRFVVTMPLTDAAA